MVWIFHFYNSPGVHATSDLFTFHLYDCIGPYHSKWDCFLQEVKIIQPTLHENFQKWSPSPTIVKGATSGIRKTCLKIDPLEPHFYIVKLEFTGVYNVFLSFVQKHRLWVLFRTASSRRFVRTASNEYPQSMFWAEI